MSVGRADYQDRRAARVAGLEKRAASTAAASAVRLSAARRIADVIPFGQPILVGHHSVVRSRRDAAKIDSNMRKACELGREAEQLARRAAVAEESTAISSDDPEALCKLRAKIFRLTQIGADMKRVNAVIRKARSHVTGDPRNAVAAALVAELGWRPDSAARAAEPDCFGNYGFAAYQLTSNRAEITRCQKRIAEIEARSAIADQSREQTIGQVRVAWTDNRIQITFPGKPSDAVRADLKGAGFRWAPSVGTWQRLASENAWRIAINFAGQTPR